MYYLSVSVLCHALSTCQAQGEVGDLDSTHMSVVPLTVALRLTSRSRLGCPHIHVSSLRKSAMLMRRLRLAALRGRWLTPQQQEEAPASKAESPAAHDQNDLRHRAEVARMRDEGYYNHFRHLYDDSAHQLRSLQPENAIAHVVDLYMPVEVQESPYTPEREVMDGDGDGGETDAPADTSRTQQMRLRGALAVQTAAKNAVSVGLGRALEGDLKGGDWRNQLSTSATELDQVTALLPQWLRKSPLLLDTDLREDLMQYERRGTRR